jgi:hypothetical protein
VRQPGSDQTDGYEECTDAYKDPSHPIGWTRIEREEQKPNADCQSTADECSESQEFWCHFVSWAVIRHRRFLLWATIRPRITGTERISTTMRHNMREIKCMFQAVRRLLRFCLVFCLALGAQCLTWAQAAEVSINQLALIHKTYGWMVIKPGPRHDELRQNDLILALDSSRTATMGPLTLVNLLNESFSRPIRAAIKRGNDVANIQLSSEEDSSGPLKSTLIAASGIRAPEFTTQDLTGKRVSLSGFPSKMDSAGIWSNLVYRMRGRDH